MPRATATVAVLAITALFGGALAAPTARRRRQATMMATVTPFAEDHFHDGYARHKCHVQPEDSSQLPFQAHCHAMEISAHVTQHMEVRLRADTVDDEEPVIVTAVPIGHENKLATAADFSGNEHCVMPWQSTQQDDPGNSCGGRTILHMRLQFDDDGPSYCDEACVAATMWTQTDADGRAINADQLFRASSYGQTYFDVLRSRVVTVRIPGSVNDYAPGFPGANPSKGCPHYSLVALAKQYLPSDIFLTEYQHHAYWLPLTRVLGCTWDGLASLRGRDTLYRGNAGGLLTHELGHNLGLGHSGVDANDDGVVEDEYGDKSGVMGTAFDGPPGYTGPDRMILGWITDGHGLYREPALSCATHDALQITLSRLDHAPTTASHTNSHGKTMVTFPRTSDTDRYYLSFYSENDVNGNLIMPHWRNQVHVHSYTGRRAEHTKHVAKLSELAPTFSGSSMGEAFEITVLSIGADSATIELSLPGCQPSTTAPPTIPVLQGEIKCGENVAGDTGTTPGVSERGYLSPEHTYSFVAEEDIAETGYTFSSCSSSFDTVLRIFDSTGAEVSSCDDCGDCGLQAILNATNLTTGDTYTILVEGYDRAFGAYELSMTVAGGGSCPGSPTSSPSPAPITPAPTRPPTPSPTPAPSMPAPTRPPTPSPTQAPATLAPTRSPALSPTPAPATPAPTRPPTRPPTPRASTSPPTPPVSLTNADYCPPGYVNSPKRYAMGMGRITIVHFDAECSNRCSLYSGVQYNGGCKGYMTGMYFGMKFCRSYGGNAQTQRCAPWATSLLDGQCCTREVVNTVPPL